MNNPQESQIFNEGAIDEHLTTNYIANREESDEGLEKPKSKFLFK